MSSNDNLCSKKVIKKTKIYHSYHKHETYYWTFNKKAFKVGISRFWASVPIPE